MKQPGDLSDELLKLGLSMPKSESLDDLYDARTGRVTTSGTHYQLHGSTNDPLVILLHGIGDFSYRFQAMVSALIAAHNQVLTFDFYGRGRSSPAPTSSRILHSQPKPIKTPASSSHGYHSQSNHKEHGSYKEYGYRMHLEQLEELLIELNFVEATTGELNSDIAFCKASAGKRHTIIAHSMGAIVAAMYAAMNPDRVSGKGVLVSERSIATCSRVLGVVSRVLGLHGIFCKNSRGRK